MKKVYLTSNIGGFTKENGKRIPAFLRSENGFVDSLKEQWRENSNILIISADADSFEINDSIKNIFEIAFPMSGLSINKMVICDRRNLDVLQKIAEFDIVILAGGHVPTQNKFFKTIHLKEILEEYAGIFIGISAGTMNCAEIVYAQPEREGESVDAEYQRFIPGLGITKLMIIPHYQGIKDDILDGKRLFEDITYPDSYEREFYALVDGSYVTIENGQTYLFGEAYLIKDGAIQQICKKGESVHLNE